jgi:dipeptidyl aminopeptidase/acylaminoacyl peptidase
MRTISGSKKQWFRHRFVWAVALLGAILLAIILASSPTSAAGFARKEPTATMVSGDGSLVYLEADSYGRPRAIVKKPRGDLDALPAKKNTGSVLAATDVPGRCEISGLHAAPKGQWVAVQINCEDGGFVQVVHALSGQVRSLDVDLNRDSIFLGWAPTGNEMIVKVDVISNPRVYLVNVASGKVEQLPVPWTTYNVALSRNGKRMICSLTRGLGYGSETWIADVDGRHARRVLVDPTHIIAFARWSPSGNKITYIRMPDSNIPFTVGELWVMDGEGNTPVLLGEADAGHGYEPAWSPDGERVAFVVRENRHDRAADQQAARLVSNIYIANVNDRKVSAVTQFEGALTETPTWSSDGEFLAFSATAEGGADVWAFEVKGQKLHRVTHGANAQCPTWLSDE